MAAPGLLFLTVLLLFLFFLLFVVARLILIAVGTFFDGDCGQLFQQRIVTLITFFAYTGSCQGF